MRSILMLAVLLLAGAFPASGQQLPATSGGDEEAAGISPPLRVGHWALAAVRRAEALGFARDEVVGQPALSRRQAERIFRFAAASGGPAAPLAASWHRRLLDEFPELRAVGGARIGARRLLGGGAVTAGYLDRAGALAPSTNHGGRSQRPLPRPDRTEPWLSLSLAGPSDGPVTFVVEPRIGTEGFDLPSWDLGVGSSGLAASVGHGAIGYGYGESGGIVFGGASVSRVQLYTPRPFALGGVLRFLGPVSFHSFIGKLYEARHRDDPYLAGARVAVRPHRRVELAASRGAMLGGDSARFGVSPVYLFRTLIGFNDAENQVVSADIRFRLPTEGVIPLTAYLEWGTDDVAGGYEETPAYVVGAYAPALPFLPELSLGVERTFFHGQCCGHGLWYRHNRFQGNWATDAAALGHPLGGHGSELTGYGTVDLYRIGVRIDARASLRDRGAENLYAPDREGRSIALEADAAWRLGRRAELRAQARREAGDGWAARTVDGGLSLFF